MRLRIVTCLLCLVLLGSVLYAQDPITCPDDLPQRTSCFSGRDDNGAHYLIAIPKDWNGTLVLINRGGPPAVPVQVTTAALLRPGYAAELLPEGFAVAASGYRRGGWAVATHAEDTENLRQIFVKAFGPPKRTIVHGFSYAGPVTAKVVELFGVSPEGSLNYDGALPFCGLTAGVRRNFYRWLDLRVVYQYYCRNHPRPDEQQYDLFMGLAPGTTMSADELRERVNECTGVDLAARYRSKHQRQNLANILNVVPTPENELVTQMSGATSYMQNLTQVQLGGRNGLTNTGVVYRGSTDDRALNQGVARYRSDPEAVDQLVALGDPTGEVAVPILTMHGLGDERVIIENAAAYKETFRQAGTLDYLFQTYVNSYGHCVYSTSEFQAVFHALLNWIETGDRPVHSDIVATCEKYRAVSGEPCRFNTAYQPQSFDARVPPRDP